MSALNPPRADSSDEPPPPYSFYPTDDISLEFGPARPFQPPPQQRAQARLQRPQQPPRELSEFAREFYGAGGGLSRSAEDLPQRPPPRQSQTQGGGRDDGRPTRTPVPGHPLLNNGKTLVYPQGYECHKCRNTGYKSFDPSHPCRRCWERFSKPYSGPIVYGSWNDGTSNRQRPLLNHRSNATNPSLSLSRSLTSIVNLAREELSSLPGNSVGRSFPPASSPLSPGPRFPVPRPAPPPRPTSMFSSSSGGGGGNGSTLDRSGSSWTRNRPPSPPVFRPGDPRIGGNLCWNCLGSGKTFGFLLLTNNTCDVCGGIGRVL